MLTDQEQEEAAAKLNKVWFVLDEFLIIKELLEMLNEQLNNTPSAFDTREERIQLLLNIYQQRFQIHFDDSIKLLLEIEKILVRKP
jgi:predicted oxidoreductase (fatty acid repression mutant protein)